MYGFGFGTVSEDDILTTNKTAVSANLNAKKTGKFGLSYLTMAGKIFFWMSLQPVVEQHSTNPRNTIFKHKQSFYNKNALTAVFKSQSP